MRVLAALTLAASLTAQIRFDEVAIKAGVSFRLANAAAGNYHQIELMPGGVAVLDYNDDGCMDIYFTNGAAQPSLQKSAPEYRNRLFRNNCNMTFTDVTEKAGVAGEGYSMGVASRRLQQRRVSRYLRHGSQSQHPLPQSRRWHF